MKKAGGWVVELSDKQMAIKGPESQADTRRNCQRSYVANMRTIATLNACVACCFSLSIQGLVLPPVAASKVADGVENTDDSVSL